jgi:hypothetical protein
MTKTSEFRAKPCEPSSSAVASAVFLPANHTEVSLNRGSFSVTAALEPAEKSLHARCLWCGRAFTPRATGGSVAEVLLHGTQATVLDRGAPLDDAGDRGGPTFGRLPEGIPHERARCLRGVPGPERASEGWDSLARGYSLVTPGGTRSPISCGQGHRNVGRLTVLGMIREIDIWRVALLMVKRYADDAEANADRRADELDTEGDQAGAAIWRRVTVAIEQLTDTTGPLH